MFLRRGQMRIIISITVVCGILAVAALVCGGLMLLSVIDVAEPNGGIITRLFILGVLLILMAWISYPADKYSLGCERMLRAGHRLVQVEMKPREYIDLYNEKKNDPRNVISQPHYKVLLNTMLAYYLTGDKDSEVKTARETYEAAPAHKKTLARICLADALYDPDRGDLCEEAEKIYNELVGQKLNVIELQALSALEHGDRAFARGDWKTAEAYFEGNLTKKSPAPKMYGTVDYHWHLAKICEATGRASQALEHYKYCADNGGETFIREESLKKLNASENA